MAKICLKDVSLDYPLYGAYDFSIKRRLLGRMLREASAMRTIRALDTISLEVTAGARIGLFGPNGSGKSTLLRLIVGVYPLSSGRLEISGSIMPLLGLNSGVNPDFTASDNISLLLRIGGRKPTAALVDEIWAFTELEDRMRQLPLRMFSSGLQMRVLFAVATACPADILLLDEWLSVVDQNFSAKAEARLLKLVSMAAIVMIASHDQGLLRRTCTSIVRLEQGRVTGILPVDPTSAHPLGLRESA
jgi:lipopolysaccharide transport system ATP-binding protein